MKLPRAEPDYAAVSKRVDEKFVCQHQHTTIRKKLAADGAISIWHQCDCCGRKNGIAIKKASMTGAQVEALPVWDTQREAVFAVERKNYFDETWAAEKERYSKAWLMAYDQYLQTPEWKRKRQLVLERAQGTCEGCRETSAVDVHHFSYDDVGEEFLFQLAALCRNCHERLHDRIPKPSFSAQPPAQA